MSERTEFHGDKPLALYQEWFRLAEASEPNDPNAAALATATADGSPSVRMVLIKAVDENGFNFFTNAESQKGRELSANPRAEICFHWKSLRRQVRIAGMVSPLPVDATEQYFHSRSRKSQIGAAVSAQSQPLESRDVLVEQVLRFSKEIGESEVPLPPFWRGYYLRAEKVEFWIDGPDRLHDRLVFRKNGEGWNRSRLYP